MKIQKEVIEDFIKRYDLNGKVSNAIWTLEDDKIDVSVKSIDKSMLGFVTYNSNPFNYVGEIGFMNIPQLKSMMSVMSDEIDININEGLQQIEMEDDSGLQSLFVLTPTTILGNKPSLKKDADYIFSLKIDDNVYDQIIKVVKTFKEDYFTILNEDGQDKLVVGYDVNKSNRIKVNLGSNSEENYRETSFKSELFLSILTNNKGADIELAFSPKLLKITCSTKDYNNVYRIAKFGREDGR